MHISKFFFDLPTKLIARFPQKKRSSCRLLILNKISGKITHTKFYDIVNKINEGDLLIFNDTKVIPARIYGHKNTGGKIEILVERILDNKNILVHIYSKRPLSLGSKIFLQKRKNSTQYIEAIIIKIIKNEAIISFSKNNFNTLDILYEVGHIPLPPYIKRIDEKIDYEYYQTIYGKNIGSIAAHTAGLHFDQELLKKIKKKNIETAFITLHIGIGTFKSIRKTNIKYHTMHDEYLNISQETINAILSCKARGNKIIAVGTSTVRALESIAINNNQNFVPYSGKTNIFIYPGWKYRVIDALITNFHLPKSTLIILVSAFVGRQLLMRTYQEAIKKKYLFFSYGDAMFISNDPHI
ncbi:tRNA preQ1(34) S-adenosylmethionine ribosyltransferase-isomerase QueA [Candidatus Tachikawaea gelatinosa]|uniref:S-adenosylmethionine:tRNA ribosyltransferase-isomerase n=1 Tax=Candidatus Tachikawaea gelatinosa TaxID=1410383 RepID=A0A090AJW2_9ENTR|nr:tRNA preQ1(34) S-adenosylmethionine ribosyltransferase-isomerase QueA [Candidatus Tachikawaea gelatinosa]BAP58748.1 S-adenosylmethionine:tRNA ribosyltransferase-isomerase [Candidatus Tachikawaea gelatinosa]